MNNKEKLEFLAERYMDPLFNVDTGGYCVVISEQVSVGSPDTKLEEVEGFLYPCCIVRYLPPTGFKQDRIVQVEWRGPFRQWYRALAEAAARRK